VCVGWRLLVITVSGVCNNKSTHTKTKHYDVQKSISVVQYIEFDLLTLMFNVIVYLLYYNKLKYLD